MKILITTNSKFFREALRFILHGQAGEIHTAADMEEFKALTRRNRYDVLMCDLDCVQEHLTEFRDWVRNNLHDARIVVFSFEHPRSIREKLGDDMVENFINRPLAPEKVLEFVRRIKNP